MIATITINERAPTYNSAYLNVKGRGRILKEEIKKYKGRVKHQARDIVFKCDRSKEHIEAEFYFYRTDVFTHDGNISLTSADWDGLIKITQDAIFDGLKSNDALICRATVYKLQSDQDMTVVILKTAPKWSLYNNSDLIS